MFPQNSKRYLTPPPCVRAPVRIKAMQILYRDDNLAVIHKPPGLSLLRDRSGARCLWDELPDLLGCKPFQVHRLDKPTSGALAVALNARTQKQLTQAFAERSVRKYYLAWVLGDPGARGTIDLPLKKGRKSRYRVAGHRADIRETGKRWYLKNCSAADDAGEGRAGKRGHPSLTRFRRLRVANGRALLLLMPRTGRTHQLRVHLSWIGHPILGDGIYGKPDDPAQKAERLFLHAHRLVLPGAGSFKAEPGEEWQINRQRTSD